MSLLTRCAVCTVVQCAIVELHYYIVSRDTPPVWALLNDECTHDDDRIFFYIPQGTLHNVDMMLLAVFYRGASTMLARHTQWCRCFARKRFYSSGSGHPHVAVVGGGPGGFYAAQHILKVRESPLNFHVHVSSVCMYVYMYEFHLRPGGPMVQWQSVSA